MLVVVGVADGSSSGCCRGKDDEEEGGGTTGIGRGILGKGLSSSSLSLSWSCMVVVLHEPVFIYHIYVCM